MLTSVISFWAWDLESDLKGETEWFSDTWNWYKYKDLYADDPVSVKRIDYMTLSQDSKGRQSFHEIGWNRVDMVLDFLLLTLFAFYQVGVPSLHRKLPTVLLRTIYSASSQRKLLASQMVHEICAASYERLRLDRWKERHVLLGQKVKHRIFQTTREARHFFALTSKMRVWRVCIIVISNHPYMRSAWIVAEETPSGDNLTSPSPGHSSLLCCFAMALAPLWGGG